MTKNLDYKKVLVGVSGGVDSSVCIDLLKKQGLEVEGVVIRFSPESDEAVNDAKRVCDKLGIPLHIADAQADFMKYVVTPFCENYVSGKTPNPCIVCNPHVKFATLIKTADELGIGYIATGHYAQVEKVGETYFVKKAVSIAKDQSYMLYRLPQEILSRLILPIGSFEKPVIREMAGELELFNADKPDSQEICFIPDGDYGSFIKNLGYKTKYGWLIAPDGKRIRRHEGVHNFTIGQRKGLNIGGHQQPIFIIHIDIEKNLIFVGEGQDHPGLYRPALAILPDEIHWVRPDQEMQIGEEREYLIRIRYRQPLQKGRLIRREEGMYIVFDEAQRGITPGQFAAWYAEDGELVGSGVINR